MNKLKSLWNSLPDGVKRVIHTGWVTFLVTFGAGLTGIISDLIHTHSFSSAKSACIALVLTALIAAGTAIRVKVASLLSKGAVAEK